MSFISSLVSSLSHSICYILSFASLFPPTLSIASSSCRSLCSVTSSHTSRSLPVPKIQYILSLVQPASWCLFFLWYPNLLCIVCSSSHPLLYTIINFHPLHHILASSFPWHPLLLCPLLNHFTMEAPGDTGVSQEWINWRAIGVRVGEAMKAN